MSWIHRAGGPVGRLSRRRLGLAASNPNLLLNGAMRQAQRGTSFDATTSPANSDGNYMLDRWALLSDGNDRADISQSTVAPVGSWRALRFQIETVSATSEKLGVIQILEARDSEAIIGGRASLSFQSKTVSGQIENLRAGILAWDGGADAPTLDVVSDWAVEGTNPTLVANWFFENTPANIALSNDFQRFTVPDIAIDTSGAGQVAVFIWVDDTDLVANDLFYIADVKLEAGSTVTEPQHLPSAVELMACKRFYERLTYDSTSGEAVMNLPRFDITGDDWWGIFRYEVEKRAQPSVTPSAVGTFDVQHDGTEAVQPDSLAVDEIGRYSCRVKFLDSGISSTAEPAILVRDETDDCFIEIDAEFN